MRPLGQAHQYGAHAEESAARYLHSLGWEILDRNVRMRCGELDIIAMDPVEDQLVVVEVRARHVGLLQSAEASVGPMKIRKLIRAGTLYVQRIGYEGNWRIDLISFNDRRDTTTIEHFKDISYTYTT